MLQSTVCQSAPVTV